MATNWGNKAISHMPHYAPVTIADLLEVDAKLMAFCSKCGHHGRIEPATLPFKADMTVPGLAGRFRCSRCGSRETSAQPRYKAQDVGGSGGLGWIMPPAE